MGFPPEADNGFCTIGELLTALPRLGLPHFQRGQVWDDGAVAKLLESLLRGTPCGSVILWVPKDLQTNRARLGTPVPEWGSNASSVEYLVVDGQQRLTTLARVFGEEEQWALNLAAVPELDGKLKPAPSDRERRRPMFVRYSKGRGPSAFAVPLKSLDQQGEAAWPAALASRAEEWAPLVRQVQNVRAQRLQVVVDRTGDLAQVVRLYNRINSSGAVVRREERAFAALFRFDHAVGDLLAEGFQAVHEGTTDRNGMLRRQREQQFGFGLFVKALAHAVGHHLNQDPTDLERIEAWASHPQWMQDAERRTSVLRMGKDSVVRVARVLSDQLHCDDLRFLPRATSLFPVFSLLLRYPDVEDPVIARCILTLQLKELMLDTIKDSELVRRVRLSASLEEALAGFPSQVMDVGSPSGQSGPSGIVAEVSGAQTMRDHLVLMLYWLQRHLGARDYGGARTLLSKDADAEKEHVVPFSLLHPVYDDLDTRGRSRTHIANALGNLTFLSHAFNREHEADPVHLWELDADILRPHFLNPQVAEQYRAALLALQGSNHADGRLAFHAFVRSRSQVIASELRSWLSEWTEVEPSEPGQRPRLNLVVSSAADDVLGRGWPRPFEQAMLKLTRTAGFQAGRWVLYRQGAGKERTWASSMIRLSQDGTQLWIGKAVHGLMELKSALERSIPGQYVDEKWEFRLDPAAPASSAALEVLAQFLSAEGRTLDSSPADPDDLEAIE